MSENCEHCGAPIPAERLYPGRRFCTQRCHFRSADNPERRERIEALHKSGRTLRAIGAEVGLSHEQVRKILRKSSRKSRAASRGANPREEKRPCPRH